MKKIYQLFVIAILFSSISAFGQDTAKEDLILTAKKQTMVIVEQLELNRQQQDQVFEVVKTYVLNKEDAITDAQNGYDRKAYDIMKEKYTPEMMDRFQEIMTPYQYKNFMKLNTK